MSSTAGYHAQIAAGIVSLAAGVAVYVLFRPDEQSLFLKWLPENFQHLPKIDSSNFMIDSFPTFSHAFAMPLLSSGLLRLEKSGGVFMCVFWASVNLCFEAGQYYGNIAVSMIPDFFESVPVLENMNDYFINGRFDVVDCGSILIGGALAYLVIAGTTDKSHMR